MCVRVYVLCRVCINSIVHNRNVRTSKLKCALCRCMCGMVQWCVCVCVAVQNRVFIYILFCLLWQNWIHVIDRGRQRMSIIQRIYLYPYYNNTVFIFWTNIKCRICDCVILAAREFLFFCFILFNFNVSVAVVGGGGGGIWVVDTAFKKYKIKSIHTPCGAIVIQAGKSVLFYLYVSNKFTRLSSWTGWGRGA